MTRTPLLAAALLAAAAPPTPAQPAAGPKKVAVLVGVNEYQDPRLGKLRYAEADAAGMKGALTGYEVTLLTGKAATKAAVERAIQTATARRDLAGGTLLLGLAGHGVQFEGGADSYFCPVDGKPAKEQADTLVSIKWVYDRLEKDAAAAGVRLLLVDACRDDPAAARSAGAAVLPRGLDAGAAPPPPKGVGVLLSCSPGERAFEHPSYKHGVFFHHVIRGLEGDAADRDGDVTWDSLRGYVKKQVATRVPDLIGGGAKQQPNETGNLSGAPPVLVPANAGFVPLFNGKDLTGWRRDRGTADQWRVLNQRAVGAVGKSTDPNTRSWLLTDRQYTSYVMRCEFQFDPGAAFGVVVRATDNEEMPFRGKTVRDHPAVLFRDPAADRPPPPSGVAWLESGRIEWGEWSKGAPANAWHRLSVAVRGESLAVVLNGRRVVDTRLNPDPATHNGITPGLKRTAGRAGFMIRYGTVRLRNVEIKEFN